MFAKHGILLEPSNDVDEVSIAGCVVDDMSYIVCAVSQRCWNLSLPADTEMPKTHVVKAKQAIGKSTRTQGRTYP